MTIIKTISESDFILAFHDYGRGDNFSFVGLQALYEWLEELSNDCEQPTELDVIALCCEFSEFDIVDAAKNYSLDFGDFDAFSIDLFNDTEELRRDRDDAEEIIEHILDHFNDHTHVIEVDEDTIIIGDY